jgi:replication fork protection complex subunit Csm3/Swi3
MAEEAQRSAPVSIFGNGLPQQILPSRPSAPEEDDLDALMAEAEGIPGLPKAARIGIPQPQRSLQDDEEDDLDALMAEAEAEESVSASKPGLGASQHSPPSISNKGADVDEEEAMAEMDGLW